jgi:hypothetical protein
MIVCVNQAWQHTSAVEVDDVVVWVRPFADREHPTPEPYR